ncbi:hypothetical protein Nocox_38425 [Nonomuraea coxensis DSM 45129]|uniref:Band 7 domain-containing protein n=1 Tax=Nonomuraea coxensis DSM 45129 TaxID=1122611 RepID=A0ABX8UBS4_9ACTN|nr:hypothetical protein [Nonomuraea coxensis]QYC45235.1 hypothetical protein Nocox_38425 [Nonomuraea coxensis DSM 45129]
MEAFTYNPILKSSGLPLVLPRKPLRPPAPGTALVLVPRKGDLLTIRHGESIPDAWYGTYRHTYLVDLREHRLVLHIPLLSSDPAFGFPSLVRLNCRVAEPDEIVSRGITDVSGALYLPIQSMLRRVSRNYDIGELHRAEDALTESIRGFSGDAALRLRNITVELVVDNGEILASGRAYREIERETRLMEMRRERHLRMLRRDGAEGLVAEIMEREGPRAAYELIAGAEREEHQELLTAWNKVISEAGTELEPWEVVQAERALRDRVTGGSSAPFGGIRSGRLRGSLYAGSATGAGHETPSDAVMEEHGTAENGSHRPSRVRGLKLTKIDDADG